MLGLSGVGGEVLLRDFRCCAFLQDASEHVSEHGTFPVPFGIDALEVVAAYCEGAADAEVRMRMQKLANRRATRRSRAGARG